MPENLIFDTVPQADPLAIFQGGRTDYQKVVGLLDFSKKDVAEASNIPKKSVRYDQRIPKELEDRLKEWAVVVAQVAAYFKDAGKTALWFHIPNPQLGDVPPRDFIRFGRYRKLLRFITNAISENAPDAE